MRHVTERLGKWARLCGLTVTLSPARVVDLEFELERLFGPHGDDSAQGLLWLSVSVRPVGVVPLFCPMRRRSTPASRLNRPEPIKATTRPGPRARGSTGTREATSAIDPGRPGNRDHRHDHVAEQGDARDTGQRPSPMAMPPPTRSPRRRPRRNLPGGGGRSARSRESRPVDARAVEPGEELPPLRRR